MDELQKGLCHDSGLFWKRPTAEIIVTAAPEEVPRALVGQLKIGGVMAIPVGRFLQELRILRRTGDGTETIRTLPVRFVPMTGKPRH